MWLACFIVDMRISHRGNRFPPAQTVPGARILKFSKFSEPHFFLLTESLEFELDSALAPSLELSFFFWLILSDAKTKGISIALCRNVSCCGGIVAT
jgi:hypothetical protein